MPFRARRPSPTVRPAAPAGRERSPRPDGLDHPAAPRFERLEDRTLFSVPDGFTQSLVTKGIDSPTAMAVAPDGRVFVSEAGGKLRVVKNGALLSTPFVTVNTPKLGERGLLGIAFDPDFAANHYVYAYYTAGSPTIHNRVSRFTANGDVAVPGSEKVLLDQPALGPATTHNGGDMHFGPDGKLYVAVGENTQPEKAQSLDTTFGKVLRINKDGTIPTDNPFYAQTTGVNRSIWARGFRNPFTFNVQPGTGKIYVNDVGHVGDLAWEEVDLLTKGANYGWPAVQGPQSDSPQYQNPVYAYQHGADGVNGICIAGGAFYNPAAGAANQFPAAYTSDYFFADYGRGWIHVLDAQTGTVSPFAAGLSNPVDLEVAADGSLLYLQRGTDGTGVAGLYRIAKVAGPGILAGPQPVTVAPGEPATFTVQANGPAPLSYQWLRDGQPIDGATAASYTLAGPQLADDGAVFSVRVTNAGGSVTSGGATLSVTTNQAPLPTIDAPAAGSKFVAGQPVDFSGGATDAEDGPVPAAGLTWSVSYFTDGQERPYVPAFAGQAGGTFTPATVTPYLGTNVFYRVYLTATDSLGRSSTAYRDVQPTVGNFALAAAVPGGSAAGLKVNLDGNPQATPTVVSSVVGLQRQLTAPASQVVNGVTYDFVSWSDGGAASHPFTVPAAATAYTATYKVRATVVKSLAPVADSWVSQQTPTTNFGTQSTLTVRRSSSVYARVTYLTFDLSAVGTITLATLKLFGGQTVAGTAVNVAAFKVANTTWGEKTVTWNTRPALGAAMGSVSVNGTTARTYQWDVTSYLKAEKAAGRNRVTIGLFGLAGTTPIAQFNAREAAVNRPVLEVK